MTTKKLVMNVLILRSGGANPPVGLLTEPYAILYITVSAVSLYEIEEEM